MNNEDEYEELDDYQGPDEPLDYGMKLYGVPDKVIWEQIEKETQQKFDTYEDAVSFMVKYRQAVSAPAPIADAIRCAEHLQIGKAYVAHIADMEEPWQLGKLLELDFKTYTAKFENNSILDILTPEENARMRVELSSIGVVPFFNGRWVAGTYTKEISE